MGTGSAREISETRSGAVAGNVEDVTATRAGIGIVVAETVTIAMTTATNRTTMILSQSLTHVLCVDQIQATSCLPLMQAKEAILAIFSKKPERRSSDFVYNSGSNAGTELMSGTMLREMKSKDD